MVRHTFFYLATAIVLGLSPGATAQQQCTYDTAVDLEEILGGSGSGRVDLTPASYVCSDADEAASSGAACVGFDHKKKRLARRAGVPCTVDTAVDLEQYIGGGGGGGGSSGGGGSDICYPDYCTCPGTGKQVMFPVECIEVNFRRSVAAAGDHDGPGFGGGGEDVVCNSDQACTRYKDKFGCVSKAELGQLAAIGEESRNQELVRRQQRAQYSNYLFAKSGHEKRQSGLTCAADEVCASLDVFLGCLDEEGYYTDSAGDWVNVVTGEYYIEGERGNVNDENAGSGSGSGSSGPGSGSGSSSDTDSAGSGSSEAGESPAPAGSNNGGNEISIPGSAPAPDASARLSTLALVLTAAMAFAV